jgi:MerR family mercuric resistance operon transcriptional regulator
VSGLRSSQVAAAAGVNRQTLRYYERRGLLAEPERSLGGHRLYPAGAVTVLRVIKAAQRLAFTLDEVTGLLEAGRHRHNRSYAGLQARAQAKLAEVEAKIIDLQAIAGTLRAAVQAGCDDLVTCAGEPCCPIPFDAIAGGPAEARQVHAADGTGRTHAGLRRSRARPMCAAVREGNPAAQRRGKPSRLQVGHQQRQQLLRSERLVPGQRDSVDPAGPEPSPDRVPRQFPRAEPVVADDMGGNVPGNGKCRDHSQRHADNRRPAGVSRPVPRKQDPWTTQSP